MLKLEVGKTYVDDEGGTHTLTSTYGKMFFTDSGWLVESDGRCRGVNVLFTLIREHTEESPAEVPAPQAQQEPVIYALDPALVAIATLPAPAPEKLHPPLPQQAATPFDQFKGFDYTVTRGGASTAVPVGKGGLSTSPDLTPMGHQVAPHWAIASQVE